MSTKTETLHDAEFMIAEAPGTISRDAVTVTVPANTTFLAGLVLAQLSASGKCVEYDNAGSDGSEEAAGILRNTIVNDTGSEADFDGVIVNFCAEVRAESLAWKDALGTPAKTAGLADLAALGIKAR